MFSPFSHLSLLPCLLLRLIISIRCKHHYRALNPDESSRMGQVAPRRTTFREAHGLSCPVPAYVGQENRSTVRHMYKLSECASMCAQVLKSIVERVGTCPSATAIEKNGIPAINDRCNRESASICSCPDSTNGMLLTCVSRCQRLG